MITKSRFALMTVTTCMVFAFSAIWTVPVFADDSTPPPPVDVPTEVVPAVDEPAAADIPPEEVVAPADVAPADLTITEVLAQAPEGTDVQVVDANGEALPLATQEAADALENGDPIWCPVGVAPKASVGGCSPNFTSFTDDATLTDQGLIHWLNTASAAAVSKAGVIWVATSYNAGVEIGPIIIDGSSVAGTMENFALTIKGGWNGTPGSIAINQFTPSPINGVSLSVINWVGSITVSDILIDGATSNSGVDDSALLVETTGNIQLDRVTVKDSINVGSGVMTGATLNNQTSTKAATVIVNNGVFENNEGDGLFIQSAGIVTITSLFANGNDGSGAVIDNCNFDPGPDPDPDYPYDDFCQVVGDKAVTLKGSQEFHNNADAGLTVSSKGLITISNIIASQNGADGVILNNTLSLTKQGVILKGTNSFVSNANGLNVHTRGTITASNLTAIDNGGTGVYLDNCDVFNPSGVCLTIVAKNVVLSGYNYLNNNGNHGLEIYSYGVITVSNLTASGNGFTGVILDNQRFNNAGVQVDSKGTIAVTGYGKFNNNGDVGSGDGLEVVSHGNIILTNLSATNNSDNGLQINAQRTNVGTTIYVANVSLTGVNYFDNNGMDGLHINSDGKITLASITASNSDSGDGAELTTTDKGYGVTLTGTNTFLNNGSNGLLVHATGAISVANLTANGNGTVSPGPPFGSGAILDNCNLNALLCTPTSAYAVTLTGYVNVSDNHYRGLQIDSLGAVTLSNVLANGNLNVGVRIQNQYNPTFNKLVVRGVTIKGTNTFYGNDSTGLVVLSYGLISLTNINANNNGDDTPGSTSGAYLNNEVAGLVVAKNIVITGVNSFSGNYLWGLEFHSSGVVSLSRISANGNDWDNANGGIDPSYIGGGVLGTAKNITMTCGHMFGNGFNPSVGVTDPAVGYHLSVLTSAGVITLKGIYSSGNNGSDSPTVPSSKVIIIRACALP